MTLYDSRTGAILIAALVIAGVGYAKYPDLFQRALPQLQLGSETQRLRSFVAVRNVYWSPEVRKLLSLTYGDAGLDGPIALHDLDDRPCRMPIDMSGEWVTTAVLAPDGRHVLVATLRGQLWWIGLESDERRLLLELRGKICYSSAVSADGRQVVVACSDGSMYLCNPERPESTRFASGLTSHLSEIRYSNDGRRLVSAGQDGWLRVWDLAAGQRLHHWKGHEQPAMAAAFLSEDRIISAGLDDTIRIWEISTGREVWRGEFGLSGVTTLAVSPDGKSAAWGGHDQRVFVWDLTNARKKREIRVPAAVVWDVKFSPDNNSLAIAGTEGLLRVYDANFGTELAEIDFGQRL